MGNYSRQLPPACLSDLRASTKQRFVPAGKEAADNVLERLEITDIDVCVSQSGSEITWHWLSIIYGDRFINYMS